MEVVGKTIDDAAGEAFDKAAKIMGLGYPGGPQIDRLAKTGDPNRFAYSLPKTEGLDYSFSGIKTSFLYHLQKEMKSDPCFLETNISHVCASYQRHIVEYLLVKLRQAAIHYQVKDIALAGGVSANSHLRTQFLDLASELSLRAHIPKFEYCTDNAAMVGIAAYFKYTDSDYSDYSVAPRARLPFN
jgi:N6-L-threonylcarbamoyladenine synthase